MGCIDFHRLGLACKRLQGFPCKALVVPANPSRILHNDDVVFSTRFSATKCFLTFSVSLFNCRFTQHNNKGNFIHSNFEKYILNYFVSIYSYLSKNSEIFKVFFYIFSIFEQMFFSEKNLLLD